jgi:hypothetical protein
MKFLVRLALLTLLLLASAFAAGADGEYDDVDAVEQRCINQLTVGGPNNVKRASKAISRGGNLHQDVYDVLAEVILQNQATLTKADSDAYA